jgi:hypothetical protein
MVLSSEARRVRLTLNTRFPPTQVFSKSAGDGFHHGLVGMDVLSQAREVRIDFDSMTLELLP